MNRREVEARKMIELKPVRIAKHGFEMRCGIIAVWGKTDKMFITAAIGNLNETQAIPARLQTHGFGIDRNWAGAKDIGG